VVKFLEQVADFILKDANDKLLHSAVVLPNKRSEIFLKNHLKNRITTTTWLPDFFTIDEFIVSTSQITELDPVSLYFELFKIHKNIAGNNARSLDDFLAWAPLMINDFNDIDLYLADAKTVFNHLSEVRAIEAWNPGKPLTELQKNYLSFYKSLYCYYTELNKNLKDKKSGYKGMIYRDLFKKIESVSEGLKWDRFILVGFNALSLAEQKIFGFLFRHFKVDALFDVDDYYFNNDPKLIHEAGGQIKKLINEWNIDNVNWISNLLKKDQKKIHVLGIPKQIGQVKYAAQILENLAADRTKESLLDTAVVLADENLLVPFLYSLPQIVDKDGEKIPYNLTMGHPLKYSAINELIKEWLTMLESISSSGSGKISTIYILRLFNNAFFRNCSDYFSKYGSQLIINEILKRNISYTNKKQILELSGKENNDLIGLLKIIFTIPDSPAEFIDLLIDFLVFCKPAINASFHNRPIQREQFILILSSIKKIKGLLEEVKSELSYRAMEKIMVQVINRNEISLKGEPLAGIQVMGMLETRTLDFENLIVLSANDGILPKTESIDSFIPFDIRRTYNLPLPKSKTDVYAYHFFRLLQRAKNIHLIYNSEPDAMGGGEKSRFILQLEEELQSVNKTIEIKASQITIPLANKINSQEISIQKTDEIIDLIEQRFKKGLSPTSLTSFIHCQLQFYFKYVIGLKAPELLENDIEANTLGNVIHGVLEDLYKPFKNKIIDSSLIKLNNKQIKERVLGKFNEECKGGVLTSGKNLLIVNVAIQYIKKFLNEELKDISHNNRILLSTEEELETIIEYEGKSIKLRGTIDRTDKLVNNEAIRIVDYKTGRVERKDLNIKNWDSLSKDPDLSKAFQLAFYSYLFGQNRKLNQHVEAGIISMRNISNGFMSLNLPETDNKTGKLEPFESIILSLVSQITDVDQSFCQTEEIKRCRFCDYRNICNRNFSEDY